MNPRMWGILNAALVMAGEAECSECNRTSPDLLTALQDGWKMGSPELPTGCLCPECQALQEKARAP